MKKLQMRLESFNKTFTRKEKIMIFLYLLAHVVVGCIAIILGWKLMNMGAEVVFTGIDNFLWDMFKIRLF